MRIFLLIFIPLLLLGNCTSGSSIGALDITFGTQGVTFIDFAGEDDTACCTVVDSTGLVYVAGSTEGATSNDLALARLTAAGVLDTSFNTTGKVTLDISSGSEDEALGIALQTDGKILVVGTAGVGNDARLTVARWTTSGALDTSFDTDGLYIHGSYPMVFRGIALDTLGRIYLYGSNATGTLLLRLTALGALDPTFGTSGSVTPTPVGSTDSPAGIVVTTSEIWLGGTAYSSSTIATATSDFYLTKASLDGTVVSTVTYDFGTLASAINNQYDVAQSLTRDQWGNLLLVGYSRLSASDKKKVAVASFDSAGNPNTSFGTLGGALFTLSETSTTGATTAISATGAWGNRSPSAYFLIAATAAQSTGNTLALLRLGSSGTLVPFLGETSASFEDLGAASTEAKSAAIQSNGKWVLLTTARQTSTSSYDFGVARFSP